MAAPQPPYGQPNQPPPGYPPAYYPVPPQAASKKSKRVWWIVGGVVGGIIVLGIVGLIFLFVSVFQNTAPARDATTAYFVAVKAHDWNAAYDRLSISLRATTKPTDLEAT